jgi:hypothetical protein
MAFPWYLFSNKKKEEYSIEDVYKVHTQIKNKVKELEKESPGSIELFLENVNRLMSNKYGKLWIEFVL